MEYSTPAQNYNSLSQSQQNYNSYNHTYMNQNVTPYPNWCYSSNMHMYSPNMPIMTPPYQNYQGYYNVFQNTDHNLNDAAKSKSKRETKPLIVIDPAKGEQVDLNAWNKKANSSLLSEIKQSQLEVGSNNHEVSIMPKLSEEIVNGTISNHSTDASESVNDIGYDIAINSTENLKQSSSIPDKLTELSATFEDTVNSDISSDNNIHYQSNSSLDECHKVQNNTKLIYDRESLLDIGKTLFKNKTFTFTIPNDDLKSILNTEAPFDATDLATNNYGLLKTPYGRSGKKLTGFNLGSLSRSANGYLPPHLRLNEQCSENADLEKFRRNFRCTLNKIAPQNFDTCMEEIKTFLQSSLSKDKHIECYIDCLIEEIFDKAVKEEAYSVTYANICTHIAKLDVKEEKWEFRASLLTRCKDMFQTPLQSQLKTVKEHWQNKTDKETDEKLKKLYLSDIDEQVQKAKDKYFGNIRFIGELYIHDLLRASIIHNCIMQLLPKSNDEDAMLSLCKLLETCGKLFDEKHHDKIVTYITEMQKILDNESLSTRVRFRLLDIIEMSERKWILRKIQEQKIIRPKTLDEVKNDVENKTMERNSPKLPNRSVSKILGSSNDSKLKTFSKPQSFEINSLALPQNNNYDLKPACNNRWQAGSGVKEDGWQNVDSCRKSTRNYKTSKQSNKQSSLSKSNPVIQRDESPSINSSKFSVLLQNEMSDTEVRNTESPNPDFSSDAKSDDGDICVNLTPEVLFSNFLDNGYLNMKAWLNQSDIPTLIYCWLDLMMERDRTTREKVGNEFVQLLSNGKLDFQDLVSGVNRFVKVLDDLITDIPKVWEFLAQFLSCFIKNSSTDVSFFKDIFDETILKSDVLNCIVFSLKYASETHRNDVKELLQNSKWLLSNYGDIMSIQSHLKSQELEFLSDLFDNSSDETSDFFESIKEQLKEVLSKDDEVIYQFLEQHHLSENKDPHFINFIFSCILSHLCELHSDKVRDALYAKQMFLLGLIDHKPNLESAALQSLMDYANELSDRDLLPMVIEFLSNSIISNDAFTQLHQTLQNESQSSSHNINTTDNQKLVFEAVNVFLGLHR